ncbi:uncharacterized protein LOC143913918 [Arctopsyche grandis]|uniref:uncharacterized protein LOC143913914 n=1 Tax=Arctopsyche grandis TaxID=121162 RepID=UPI00406D9963
MKFMIVLVSVLGATIAKPSIGHGNFIQDGGSFSYSYQTPVVHSLVHQARYVQAIPALPVAHSASVVVGPSVRYSYGAVPIAYKNVEPANIQLSSDGFVLDTEEVAKARAEHLATVAQESARAAASGNDESEGIIIEDADSVEVAAPVIAAKSQINFQPANIQLSSDGHVLDTPEVAQARADHLARFAAESAKSSQSFSYSAPNYVSYNAAPIVAAHYVTPVAKAVEIANIQVSSDGHVLDTPEVAQAKADHFARFAAESAKSSQSFSYSAPNYVSYNSAPIVAAHYVTPVAKAVEIANIQVSSDGHVLDTPEVAQAKADHLARFAAESAKASQSIAYSAPSYAAYNYVQAAPVVVPKAVEIANIQLSADGHVLDTPEVAQAKAEHFAQYNSDAARAAAAGDDTESYDESNDSSFQQGDSVSIVAQQAPLIQYKVDDAPADIKVSSDGFVLDTPEVAQAKSAHLAEVAKSASESSQGGVVAYGIPSTAASYVAYTSPAVAYTGPAVAYTGSAIAYAQPKWVGPEADIHIGADGYVEDTFEVQQARAEHLATRASIMANSQSSWSGAASRYASAAHAGQYIQDTAEVAAARAAHLQAHAAEAAKATSSVKSYNYGRLVYSAPVYRTVAPNYSYVYSSPSYKLLSYRYAPTAAPVALTPDGQFLLDTPEVAIAKADHFAAHARARGY